MNFFHLLYLYLPAFVANSTPVLIQWVPGFRRWNAPLHTGLFGSHKTYRGLVMGIALATIVGALQGSALIGFLLGAGALLGDIVKSFCKRRIGIAPGKPWFPWDGVDYIIGAMVMLSPITIPSFGDAVLLLIAAPLLSMLANAASYLLGWKETWH